MPKTTKGGDPKKNELPSTLRRSSAGAQRTFAKAHDAAADQYGKRSAHRVAYAALKHSFERGGLSNPITSDEGVDANASKTHLLGIAGRLEVRGRSTMAKADLVEAITKHTRRVRS